ncbi:MAG: xanthine dehydrogenase small subunit [Geminicoccaceae bacterium]
MTRPLRFLLGSELVEIDRIDPTITVLDWLRLERRRTGTKEGCNEGDCGACTVVVTRLENGRPRHQAVNACIHLIGMLDGCRLTTIEHLREPVGAPHPVQQAMVDHHASQCGFCTPGFVMALYALGLAEEKTADDRTIDDALAGNLCRCTGYAPIARAAEQVVKSPFEPIFADLDRLQSLQDDETVEIGDGGRRFLAPADLDGLVALLDTFPEATILAGCTDVGLWITKQMRRLDAVIWIGRVRELSSIRKTNDNLEIGAGVSWTDAISPLTDIFPDMEEMLRRFACPQVRNAATVGGNIANGSPIGDGSPALIAAGATLHLRQGMTKRCLPIEAFFLDYGEQDRAPGEFLTKISVPKPKPGSHYRCYKISKRLDQDISAVLGAFMVKLEGEAVAAARLAFGGMAAIPKRSTAAEAVLIGRLWDRASMEAAAAALAKDFEPISDMRASADYRLMAARNLLTRFWIETTTPEVATRLARLDPLCHG